MKKPVRKRNRKRVFPSVTNQTTEELANPPSNELMKNNFIGENRSAKEKKANTNVPTIKPNMTAVVTKLIAY